MRKNPDPDFQFWGAAVAALTLAALVLTWPIVIAGLPTWLSVLTWVSLLVAGIGLTRLGRRSER
jgi:hypothetical protein